MQLQSFEDKLEFNDARIVTSVILETSFTKEIRILLKQGQVMKEHKTPYAIIIHLLEGELNFGVEGVNNYLKKGAIVTLEGNVKHDLSAITDCVVRLSLSKLDTIQRVENVINNT